MRALPLFKDDKVKPYPKMTDRDGQWYFWVENNGLRCLTWNRTNRYKEHKI